MDINDSLRVPKLTYRIELISEHENNNEAGILNAETGEILSIEPFTIHSSAIGTFATRYSGSQQAITEYTSGNYILLDLTRGATIHTWDYQYNTDLDEDLEDRADKRDELSDGDNNWTYAEYHSNKDDMGLDIHWGFQKIWDYLWDEYGINNFDDDGAFIEAYFHAYLINGGHDNAGYNSKYKVFLFGDGYNYGDAFASLDVIAHEYGHGISDQIIGWSYVDSFQYLQEGLSDIWAVILENRIRPNSIWKMGEQIIIVSGKDCFRNIQTPRDANALDQVCDYYCGTDYHNGNQYDKGGVFSHWFYHLVNGGDGFDGIGMDKAENIVIQSVNWGNLNYAYDYPSLRQRFIFNTEILYGDCSNEVKQVMNAWHAVNVGGSWPALSVSIQGDDEVQIYSWGNWTAVVSGGAITPNGVCNHSFEWSIDEEYVDDEYQLNYYFDEQNWYGGQQIEIDCEVYDGSSYAYAPTFNVQLLPHDPLSASISGDETICIGDEGIWCANASGGDGEYTYMWYINEEYIDTGDPHFPYLYYEFDPGEWTASSLNTIDLRVYDDSTFIDAETLYFETEWCFQMGGCIQITPNPASEYVILSIVESGNPMDEFKQIDKNYKKKDVDYEEEIIIYYIYNNLGKQIFIKKTTDKTIRILVSNIKSGTYFIKVTSPNITDYKQLMIMH